MVGIAAVSGAVEKRFAETHMPPHPAVAFNAPRASGKRPHVRYRRCVEIRGVFIEDTFAEAFGMRAARVVITARTMKWARAAALKLTGFATSVIACKCEAAI